MKQPALNQIQDSFERAFLDKNVEAMAANIKRGANPDCKIQTNPNDPPLWKIFNYPSCYENKIAMARVLIESGSDLDYVRNKSQSSFFGDHWFDERVLSLGSYNDRAGDEIAAGYILAQLIAHDVRKGRAYTLPIEEILDGVGSPKRGDTNSVGEQARSETAAAIIRNQHALVDYVATSNDKTAQYLRTRNDHPDSIIWLEKMAPINVDHYPRPTTSLLETAKLMEERANRIVQRLQQR